MRGFQVAALSVGRGELGIGSLPGRGGGYGDDLAALLRWRPALVVSMTTAAEMAQHGAANLAGDIASQGVAWRHLPVADFGAPDAATEALWPEASRAAQQVLGACGRVFIHCHGGCGRSGMAALRLMIEAGEPPDDALRRLRAARPCAVETDAQEAWAVGHQPKT